MKTFSAFLQQRMQWFNFIWHRKKTFLLSCLYQNYDISPKKYISVELFLFTCNYMHKTIKNMYNISNAHHIIICLSI